MIFNHLSPVSSSRRQERWPGRMSLWLEFHLCISSCDFMSVYMSSVMLTVVPCFWNALSLSAAHVQSPVQIPLLPWSLFSFLHTNVTLCLWNPIQFAGSFLYCFVTCIKVTVYFLKLSSQVESSLRTVVISQFIFESLVANKFFVLRSCLISIQWMNKISYP